MVVYQDDVSQPFRGEVDVSHRVLGECTVVALGETRIGQFSVETTLVEGTVRILDGRNALMEFQIYLRNDFLYVSQFHDFFKILQQTDIIVFSSQFIPLFFLLFLFSTKPLSLIISPDVHPLHREHDPRRDSNQQHHHHFQRTF